MTFQKFATISCAVILAACNAVDVASLNTGTSSEGVPEVDRSPEPQYLILDDHPDWADETRAQDTLLPGATPISARWEVAGDVDFFRFAGLAGGTYTIETQMLSSDADSFITVIDRDQVTALASDDDSGVGQGSRITWSPSQNGTYYVRVRHYTSTGTGSYSVSLSALGVPALDDHADTIGSTTESDRLRYAPLIGQIESGGDVDFFVFAAVDGRHYEFETSNNTTGMDTVLTLYDRFGYELDRDDDSGVGSASRIAWEADDTEDVYVRVSHFSTFFGVGTYGLVARVADDHPNSASETNDDDTLLIDGTRIAGEWEMPGDIDFFRFNAVAGADYILEATQESVDADTVISLISSNGFTELAQDDDSGIGNGSRLEWHAAVSGTYFVRVRHHLLDGVGSYTVSARGYGVPGTDDHPDDIENVKAADLLSPRVAIHAYIEDPGDVDAFGIDVVPGQIYTVRTASLSPGMDTVLTLLDSAGNQIAKNDDLSPSKGASLVSVRAYRKERLYAIVGHFSGAGTGSYDLFFRTDDHPADPRDAELYDTIVLSGPRMKGSLKGKFDVGGDIDVFRFEAEGLHTYVIRTALLSSDADTAIQLIGTDGVTVLASNNNSGGTKASKIRYQITAPGSYFVRVRHARSGGRGAYRLGVRDRTDLDPKTADPLEM